jgi:hypothetical protein
MAEALEQVPTNDDLADQVLNAGYQALKTDDTAAVKAMDLFTKLINTESPLSSKIKDRTPTLKELIASLTNHRPMEDFYKTEQRMMAEKKLLLNKEPGVKRQLSITKGQGQGQGQQETLGPADYLVVCLLLVFVINMFRAFLGSKKKKYVFRGLQYVLVNEKGEEIYPDGSLKVKFQGFPKGGKKSKKRRTRNRTQKTGY